jgi:hypothetical protein
VVGTGAVQNVAVAQITSPPAPVLPGSPAARRLTPARWRDPRLWVGLVLVAASVLVGARLLAAADDTVGVWAVVRDVSAGAPLTPEAMAVRQVRFTDPVTAAGYLPADRPVPAGAVAGRDLAAGELVTRAAVGSRGGAAFEVPVVVDDTGAPGDLRAGDVVDVWVAPPEGVDGAQEATRVLTRVPVVAATRSAGPFGDAATRQVLLGLEADASALLGPVLGQTAAGSVVLVRHGSGR